MPQPNWGRKGASKLEDDALFKAIGGQLGGKSFDYTEWQRTNAKSPTRGSSSLQKEQERAIEANANISIRSPQVKRPDTTLTTSSTSTGGRTLASLRKIGSACAPSCKHGGAKQKRGPEEEAKRKKKEELCKILMLKIRATKHALTGYKTRYHELMDINIRLKDDIDSGEGQSHNDVKKMLRKYEKFRGGIATLNEKFIEESTRVTGDLKKTKRQIDTDIADLERQVEAVDTKLKEKQKELNILMNYKDKEYPLKSLRISELQKEIEDVNVQNQEDTDELQHICDTEMDKYRKERHKAQKDITDTVAKQFIDKMHPTWSEMSQQNLVMLKEIEYHKKEQEELEEVLQLLDQEVKRLLRDPKTNVRQQMFPQFYPTLPKCTPDMEVVLDIPTQQWLPI